eukprot:6183646-Pleurochrysis_carterae.AAC.3
MYREVDFSARYKTDTCRRTHAQAYTHAKTQTQTRTRRHTDTQTEKERASEPESEGARESERARERREEKRREEARRGGEGESERCTHTSERPFALLHNFTPLLAETSTSLFLTSTDPGHFSGFTAPERYRTRRCVSDLSRISIHLDI